MNLALTAQQSQMAVLPSGRTARTRANSYAAFAVAMCWLACLGTHASAGALGSHAYAATYGPYEPVYDSEGAFQGYGLEINRVYAADSAVAGPKASADGNWTASSAASAQSVANGLLKARASSSAAEFGFDAVGAAGWRDVAYVSNAAPGSAIRLWFSVEGKLSADLFLSGGLPIYQFSNTWSELGISTTSSPLDFFENGAAAAAPEIQGSAAFDIEATLYRGNQLQTSSAPGAIGIQADGTYEDIPVDSQGNSGYLAQPYFGDTGRNHMNGLPSWASMSWDGENFAGEFYIDTTYDAELGGYGWGVLLTARAQGTGGSASADAFHTLTLDTVTLEDGTPIDVTFDSGLRLNAVPEPSTLLLSSLGFGTIGLVRRLRRKSS